MISRSLSKAFSGKYCAIRSPLSMIQRRYLHSQQAKAKESARKIHEEVLEPCLTEEEEIAKKNDPVEQLKRSQINRDSTNQQLPGDDRSFKSAFKLYRILYMIAGVSLYALVYHDSKALAEYKIILHGLRTEDPKFTGVLVGNDKSYYLRLEEGHETTVEDLGKRFEKEISNLSKLLSNQKYQASIYLSLGIPLASFTVHLLHIFKYREFTKAIPLKILWILIACFCTSCYSSSHLPILESLKGKDLKEHILSKVELLPYDSYMNNREKYDKMRDLLRIIKQPQEKEKGRPF
ncbi:unnamed protein product [Moneuplotes crassus]|uniref:Uncharacterized protein n=1 Tax=Euplotes crassus TaxID=5936 RepID=A0AAD2D0Y3_EUPCR|nr:unnamed protein product [Moneuplotes crassus]